MTTVSVAGNDRRRQQCGGGKNKKQWGRGECRMCYPSGQMSADPVWHTAASGAADGERLVNLSVGR